ncbi:MAG: type II secretion system F family protein [Deltaproteobacteria bacterium]|nr:type II secretion system F family protein [Deltaproteobacteria bacterium]
MTKFHYEAVDSTGNPQVSEIDAESSEQAMELLASRNLTVLEVKEKSGISLTGEGMGTVAEPSAFYKLLNAIPLQIILVFYEQLSFLISSGIPIYLSIRMVMENIKNAPLVKVLQTVMYDLSEGFTLSMALQKYPHHFPPMQTHLIAIGEKTGNLDKILNHIVDLVREQQDIRDRFVKAASYPLFLLGMTLTLVFGMVYFVFPKFADIFNSFKVGLPPTTQFLMGLSKTLNEKLPIIGAVAAGIIAGGIFFFKSERTSGIRDQVFLRIPFFNQIYTSMFVSLLAKMLGSLLASGIPLLEALVLCSHTIRGKIKREFMEQLIAGVREGEAASTIMRRSKLIPELAIQLTAVGEQTGRIDKMMDNIFRFYKQQYTERITLVSSALQPMLMIFMALVVGVVAMSLFVPLFKLSSTIRRSG